MKLTRLKQTEQIKSWLFQVSSENALVNITGLWVSLFTLKYKNLVSTPELSSIALVEHIMRAYRQLSVIFRIDLSILSFIDVHRPYRLEIERRKRNDSSNFVSRARQDFNGGGMAVYQEKHKIYSISRYWT